MQGEVEPDAGGLESEQTLADSEQTLADSDQTLSDRDQTASDGDQTAADRDELAAARDQRSADRDQAAADRDQAAGPAGEDDSGYALGRRSRSQSSLDRDLSSEERTDTARARVIHADQRDAIARCRDGAADMRDRIAAVQDEHDAELDGASKTDRHVLGMQVLLNASRDRERAAANRKRAAAQRAAAADDRAHAAQDRRQTALDRAAAASELGAHGFDHLTGALRRQVGMVAIERELARSERAREPLVVALIDVDGLESVNGDEGHDAGDELLRAVSRCVSSRLRSHDLIARYGGAEFVVSMAGQPAAAVRARFDEITQELARTTGGATITVGFAERRPDDALATLIARADDARREARARRS